MKQTLILLIILVSLSVIYFATGSKEDNTSIRIEDREFILEEPEDVEVLTIESKARPVIHLSKRKDGWYINDKQKANDRIVKNMLRTMNRMSIKYIPAVEENKTAIKRMANHAMDIKAYDSKGKLINEFVLGTNTNDEYGTYCMRPGSKQSYVMSIPSIQGGIRNYFTQSQEEMRELMVFSYDPNDIREIRIDYPKSKQDGFTLSREGAAYELKSDYTSGEPVANVIEAYFKDYSSLVCEFVQNDHELKDSILALIPFMKMTVEAQNREPLSLDIFPAIDMTDTSYNTRSPDDLSKFHEKFFAHSNLGDFYYVQSQFIRRYMQKPSYFYRK